MAKWCHVVGCWESDVEEVVEGIDKETLCADCDGCEEVDKGRNS
jgi:hypothetical protein